MYVLFQGLAMFDESWELLDLERGVTINASPGRWEKATFLSLEKNNYHRIQQQIL